jgi:hypothetical protein
MIQERYRQDYDGEFVLLQTSIRNGVKEQRREWMINPIQNQHVSGRAAVIGSNLDREQFDYTVLTRHRGGLLGNKRLQTYGSRDVWKDMRFDFFVTKNREQLEQIKQANYQESTVVYTNTGVVIDNPGKFYVIPHSLVLNEIALNIYIAAFDGHKEIFLLGYNKDVVIDRDQQWVRDVETVFKAYPSVLFYLVGTNANMFDNWKANSNVKCIPYREFITYCDI